MVLSVDLSSERGLLREQLLRQWAADQLRADEVVLQRLAGDAGHRRYFRLITHGQRYILMDELPENGDCDAFYFIAMTWRSLGISVPNVLAYDKQQGFLILSDFGDEWYLQNLNPSSSDILYSNALNQLLKIHRCQSIEGLELSVFDQGRYQVEFSWFVGWYLQQYRGVTLSRDEERMLQDVEVRIIRECMQQPQVLIHYDFHSRNLMCLPDNSVGVLDFQDAKMGPITYDVASLLNDCYIDWPRDQVERWCQVFLDQLIECRMIESVEFDVFMRWFDYVSMHRHLRNLGNFARLSLLHNKHGYVQYYPRMQSYLLAICSRYSELVSCGKWLAQHFQGEEGLR